MMLHNVIDVTVLASGLVTLYDDVEGEHVVFDPARVSCWHAKDNGYSIDIGLDAFAVIYANCDSRSYHMLRDVLAEEVGGIRVVEATEVGPTTATTLDPDREGTDDHVDPTQHP